MGTGTGGLSTTLVPTRLLASLRGTQASEGVHPPDAPEPRPLNDAPERSAHLGVENKRNMRFPQKTNSQSDGGPRGFLPAALKHITGCDAFRSFCLKLPKRFSFSLALVCQTAALPPASLPTHPPEWTRQRPSVRPSSCCRFSVVLQVALCQCTISRQKNAFQDRKSSCLQSCPVDHQTSPEQPHPSSDLTSCCCQNKSS